jgi:competence protein ComEC
MKWIPFAMVRIAAVFIAGVLFCIYKPDIFSEHLATILLLVFLTIYFLARFLLNRSPIIKIACGVVGLTGIFLGGYLNVLLRDESKREDHLNNSRKSITAYQVKLISPAEEKEKSFKRVGSIQAIRTDNGWRSASGKVNLYWPKQEAIINLDYGDILLIKGFPRELESAYNPYEFDFKEFLRFKNTYHQQFVKGGEWRLIQKSDDKGFLFYAHSARNWSVAAVKKYISAPRERAIVTALVLGVTDGLDTDLLNAYSAAGAMHVLAVSGLHVSIIYGILLFFFKPLGKSQSAQWTVAILSLILLWGYAFITGLSPSVLRAVMMFTFVAIAKPVGRSTNIYNTLAASAFCLLLFDPYLIMSVGFQLSYLAVLGIVYMQGPLYNLWEAKSAFLDWAWQLTCVSIVAQIATFALGFLYFHQFPVYFLLANLFVIPGSFVVLVGGILLMIISPFPAIAVWLGIALEWFVKILNEGIFLVEQLPYSLISDVYISAFQCYILFAVVLAGLVLIQFKKIESFLLMFACVVMFSYSSWQHFDNDIKKSTWTVYRIQGHTAMEWTRDGHCFFVADTAFLNDRKKIKFHLQSNRLMNGVREISQNHQFPYLSKGIQLYECDKKIFLWIADPKFKLPEKLTIDYLILSNNSVKSLSAIVDHIQFGQLIFDASNSYRYCEKMEKEADKLGKSYYSVLKKGAFVLDL